MKYLFALFLAVASLGSAFADSQDTTVFTVPFAFIVGTTNFPAGTYSIRRIWPDPSGGLRIESKDGKTAAFFHSTTSEPSDLNGAVKVQFQHEGDEYFLTGIFGELDTYTVAPGRHPQRMAHPDQTVVTTVGP
jgi:hypothetical protein